MILTLFNTLTKTKEIFTPLNPDNIGMYVCGPTVYDKAHIGNARPVIVFDVLYRLLKKLYPKVTYVRNITDVDDKIIDKSVKTGEPIFSITKKTTKIFHEDIEKLYALLPDIEPKATEHINDMIDLVSKLIEKGHAYSAENHVLFDVSSMPNYGSLSGRSLDEMIAGARVEVAPYKKNPADFILWKPSLKNQIGWDSPFGYGRPGWHLECSAMSSKYLGNSFDIHGGGQDLIFPHHENEIAQSRCCYENDSYARYWIHNGHLMVNGEKMSKSKGNFFTIQEVLEKAHGEAVRLCMLSTHYHQPLNWTDSNLNQAVKAVNKFYTALRNVENIPTSNQEPTEEIMSALCDDLNTPLAISELHNIVSALNKADNDNEKSVLKGKLITSAKMLGLLNLSVDEWFKGKKETSDITEEEINNLINERKQARLNKNYQKADEIRKNLELNNIILEDTKDGTIWKKIN